MNQLSQMKINLIEGRDFVLGEDPVPSSLYCTIRMSQDHVTSENSKGDVANPRSYPPFSM